MTYLPSNWHRLSFADLAFSFVGFSQPKPANQQCFSLKKISTNQSKPAPTPTSEQTH